MAIRWLTDADRQDMRDAAEECRVLDDLYRKCRTRVMTPEERAEAIEHFRTHGEGPSGLPIDPYRRG